MPIIYRENAPVAPEALTKLYLDAGWTAYTDYPEKMARLLPGALWHLSAWEGEDCVGLIRCVGDDASILYIQDILVKSSHQRRGIGGQLLERALARFAHIRQTVLLTDNTERNRAFYEALGFRQSSDLGTVCYARYTQGV